MRLLHYSPAVVFIYVKGHHLIEFYFSVPDARVAANDLDQSGIE